MGFSGTDGATPTVSQPIDGERGAVLAVVNAVAAVDNRPPTALPPLGETTDTDALSDLVESGAIQIAFDYAGHHVVVTSERVELY
jgi:hypothetical protein